MKNRQLLTLLIIIFLFFPFVVFAQSPNDDILLFREDRADVLLQKQNKKQKVINSILKNAKEDIRFSADKTSFDNQSNTVKLKGNILGQASGYSFQADEATIDLEKQELFLRDNIVLANPQFNLRCSQLFLNVPYETGVFQNMSFSFPLIEFKGDAKAGIKYDDLKYKFYDASLTACFDNQNNAPWQISAEEIDLTREGYAHTYNSVFSFYSLPIIYLPYIGFPVKQEKSSGLLVPSFGVSNQDGLEFSLPFHLVFDDTADMTVSPFLASETRIGSRFEFRRNFDKNHIVRSSAVVSDETLRGDDLRGLLVDSNTTNNEDINEVPFDKNRLGVYYYHLYNQKLNDDINFRGLADIHYVSDDLILRELPDDKIGLRNINYTSSRVLFDTNLYNNAIFSVKTEYNQAIDTNIKENDEVILQRFPEANLDVFENFNPLPSNPFGIQFNTSLNFNYVNFQRDLGLDGSRYSINPKIDIPFRYENYFNGGFATTGFFTRYSLNQDAIDLDEQFLDKRDTYLSQVYIDTAFERVYEIEEQNFFSKLTSLGGRDSNNILKKLKHVIEPRVIFSYIPDESQDDLPFFDAFDRIRGRTLVTYGLSNSFFARSYSSNSFLPNTLTETSPTLSSLSQLDTATFLPNSDWARSYSRLAPSSVPVIGNIRKIVDFGITQSYDFLEAKQDNDPIREAFSDINFNLNISPNSYFLSNFFFNYSPERSQMSSWGSGISVEDDRGDLFSFRYFAVEPLLVNNQEEVIEGESLRNLDANLEIQLLNQLKLAYFARYDVEAGDFIDNIGALRVYNESKCWHVDIGISERTNPDRQQFLLSFALADLGDFTQRFLLNPQN